MGLFEDLNTKIDEVKQAASAEHDEVLAAIDAIKATIATDPSMTLTADQKTQVMAKFDELKDTVTHVFDATTTP